MDVGQTKKISINMASGKELLQVKRMISEKEIAKYSWYEITGRSMEPEFSIGDQILVEHVRAEDINPGNIVTFKRYGELITHRVVRKIHRGSKILFDEKANVDIRTKRLLAEDIVGKVIAIKKDGRVEMLGEADYNSHKKAIIGLILLANFALRAVRSIRRKFGTEKPGRYYQVVRVLVLRLLGAFNLHMSNALAAKSKNPIIGLEAENE